MKWRVIVKFDLASRFVMPTVRAQLFPYGLDLWWIPKMD